MTLTIPVNDHGQIRVFEMRDALADAAKRKTPQGLADLLGTDALDPDFIDIVNIDDLGTMRLTDYIAQGYDMETSAQDVAAVNAITGHAILIMSRAARGQEVTLKPASGVRHVTTYLPKAQLEIIAPLTSDAASGIINDPPGKPPKSDARIGGMVAMYALIAMFLLVGLMVWIAA